MRDKGESRSSGGRKSREFKKDAGKGGFREKRKTDDSKPSADRPRRSFSKERPCEERRERSTGGDRSTSTRPSRKYSERPKERGGERKSSTREDRPSYSGKERGEKRSFGDKKHFRPYSKRFQTEAPVHGARPSRPKTRIDDGTTRLNKYISNSGICSRREADELITAGVIKVNGEVVTTLGYKVGQKDEVRFHDRVISKERKVYLVLNKPKDYITSMDDPLERKTVMSLVSEACRERIYPVGRLDRSTTGVLLFTNDGDLAKRLTHPSHNVVKTYFIELDRGLKDEDMDRILAGVELEDGKAFVDNITFYSDGKTKSKRELVLEIHSGRNRIVRRIFEALGYMIIRLDRISFAGITKKELPRGKWRFLAPKEVGFLKMQAGSEVE